MAMEEGEEEERRGRIGSVCLQANRGTKREGSADETPHASMIWIGSRGLLGGVWSAGPRVCSQSRAMGGTPLFRPSRDYSTEPAPAVLTWRMGHNFCP
ncbi:hypothetical protein SAMN05192589_10685 [Paracidovorax valerianellae]|uniref:Uncharacterized protein n=1 Tax=Paracidovorax valerianellae TaxID=187868 RepID=A0A1G6UH89_9BURK|nr:hypothetical protein SAMN05192589_10685 [Paracidovorax valerianellae]